MNSGRDDCGVVFAVVNCSGQYWVSEQQVLELYRGMILLGQQKADGDLRVNSKSLMYPVDYFHLNEIVVFRDFCKDSFNPTPKEREVLSLLYPSIRWETMRDLYDRF